ncbi:hypothetical protein P775_23300 [Puniceibacterium antarcticum]|uniref:Peptidase M15C domain-containing protein n=1 Tax=Puniceibacterium antarcticum TaxID=1206336 RepID=A0A2G8R896_9RHOB|nr:M15 family metallopeptidase [Puniceibacterium antarcticum]PIL17774.1 hypothetical protein P775_23300 [Puniceibacterium antarcticum]
MTPTDVQMLLASASYYTCAIDGDPGPKTMAAVAITERNANAVSASWSKSRRLVAAGQRILNAQGFEAGHVDGYAGHNTTEALTAWRSARAGASAAVERVALAHPPEAASIPTQAECSTYYGQPGTDAIGKQLVYVTLPFDLRIDWALDQTTRRIRVHTKAADSLERALLAVFDHYGSDGMRDLGIDRFAGSYVERRMRGGTSWSMHSYGCAIDLFAAPNALRLRCPQALFCGPDYKPLLDIMQANEWLPAIRLWGSDAMHFQRARM